MRTLAPWVMGLLLLIAPVAAFGDPVSPLTLDDVFRLHFAGVSEDIIVSEVIVTESVFYLTPEEIIRLKETGASDRLIQFLIDTARTDEYLYFEGEGDEDVDEETYEGYADDTEEWASVIEEDEVTTTEVRVTLDYHYSDWWYDHYWYDYWYWDFHYYPYRVSYVWHYGGWYPGWYTSWNCHLPPYWWYRYHYYDRHGYWAWYDDPYYHVNDWDHYAGNWWRSEPSQVKGKTNRYQTGGSGKAAYVHSGLKVRDFGDVRVATTAKTPTDRRHPSLGGKAYASGGDDVKIRPADGRGPTGGTKAPVTVGDRRGERKPGGTTSVDSPRPSWQKTPVRTVRGPATGTRPVKVVRSRKPTTQTKGTDPRVTSPRRPSGKGAAPKPKRSVTKRRQSPPAAPAPTKPRPQREVKKTPPPPRPQPKVNRTAPSRPQPSPPRQVQPAPSRPAPKPSAPPAKGRSSSKPPRSSKRRG